MDEHETSSLIVDKLVNEDWSIDSINYANRITVCATKMFAKIEISTEECLCHGGRLWITNLYTNNYYEIAHERYDKSLGITDSSSELRYIIENEMMPKVREFDSFVYKLTKINEYGPNSDGTRSEKVTYYKNLLDLVRSITKDSSCTLDLFAINTYPITFLNKNYSAIVERIYKDAQYPWEQNRIWFKYKLFVRDKNTKEMEFEREYEMYVSIFEKN